MPHPFAPSANVATIRESATIAVSTRAKQLRASGRHVIDLGAGEPDAPTPQFICDAAASAVAAGATRYTPVEGIAPLREAIAADANARSLASDPVAAGDVVVSTGTKQAIFNACYTLFGPRDEVLIPTPAWTSYYEMVRLARATPIPVHGSLQRDLKVDVDLLRHAPTSHTRGIILNSPCNPTGAIYSRDELAEILALAAEKDWWVLSDEIYQRLSYDSPAASALDVAARSRSRLVVFNGMAKAYAMTGWRVGWAIAPSPVARAMTALQSHTTSNAATVSQHAALAALTCRAQADHAVGAMVAELRRRRDAVCSLLRASDVDFVPPAGAFYAFVRVRGDGQRSDLGGDFARRLLDECNVAVVPGSAFGTPEWIRLSFAASFDDVLEGVRRVIAATRTVSPSRV